MVLSMLNIEQQHRKNVDSIIIRLKRLPKIYTVEVMAELGVSRVQNVDSLKRVLIEHNAERVYLIEKSLASIEKRRRTKGIRYR